MSTRPSESSLKLTQDNHLAGMSPLDDPRLRRVLDVLNPADEETRLVGGAVRNALLGLAPGDIDLATTLRPEEVVRRARMARLRSIPTGIAHGTVTVMAEKMPFEVTTLREDVETDGRHAVVRFGRDFALDAQRRDFTINGLSMGPDGRIFDTVGGLDDLARGRVRFIGDASTRIREDFLRILRFFRFHATYGTGALDPEGLAAAIANRDGLARLSRERVRAEFLKILVAPGALDVVRVMDAAGILDALLGGPTRLENVARLVAFEAGATDPILRLAALAAQDAADTSRLRDRLRLSNAETNRIEAALRAETRIGTISCVPDRATLLRTLFEHGRQAAADALRLRHATLPDRTEDEASWRQAASFLAQAAIPVLPYGGADMMKRGLKGPAVGAALAKLQADWAEAGFPDAPDSLELLLDDAVASAERQATS